MHYAYINGEDIVNGTGVRVTIYVSGCSHHCPGCFNKELWDYNFGKEFTESTIIDIIKLLKPSYIQGLTILGGEPFAEANRECIYKLIREFRKAFAGSKNLWIYSGYTFGDLYNDETTRGIVELADVIVDGKFDEKLITHSKFRGSSNQRIIDVQKTIKTGKVELYEIKD